LTFEIRSWITATVV